MPLSAYIVEAVRTPAGKNRGKLSGIHPVDLGAVVLDELVNRTGINPSDVDDVIFGCVSQVGAQAVNIARQCVLASRHFPESVPGTTVDRQCGSSQQAVHFAAQAVMSGTCDIVVAGGVESMSTVPIGSNVTDGMSNDHGNPFLTTGIAKNYPGKEFSQFKGAEMVAQKYGIQRAEMDQLAVESHRRAHQATQEGRFKKEIVPVQGFDKKTDQAVLVDQDEGIRWPLSLEKVAKLRTLSEGGRLTAGTASQISDGAAALLIVNERGLRRLGLRPRARIVQLSVTGACPETMLDAPIPATKMALRKSGLTIQDIDVYEVNEAFASIPLAWAKEIGGDLAKMNVNGGAMALGHPLGASGAKLMTTLVHEMERRQLRYGLQTMCEGGGMANCTILERCTEPIATAKL